MQVFSVFFYIDETPTQKKNVPGHSKHETLSGVNQYQLPPAAINLSPPV
jgi:hypothetical protein